MSYQPVGKRFKIDGESYCLGVAEDDLGMRVIAVFKNIGGQWTAMIPVLADNVRNDDIMAFGSVGAYITMLLPKATDFIKKQYVPVKPASTDKAMCAAYDLALDVDFDEKTMSFSLNKQAPLSHAR